MKKRNLDTFKVKEQITQKLNNSNNTQDYFLKALKFLFEIILFIKASQNFTTVSDHWEEVKRKERENNTFEFLFMVVYCNRW